MQTLIRSANILLLLFILCGCSAIRIGYNNAQELSYYWLDSYVDFTTEQKPLIKAELATLHEWHRLQEIPAYIKILREAREKVLDDTKPEEVCSLLEDVCERIRVFNLQTEPIIEKLAPTLGHEQVENIQKRFEHNNKKWRTDWLEGRQEKRDEHRLKLAVRRAETFYGSLSPEQKEILRESLRISIFNADTSYEERVRRQSDAIAILKKIIDLRLTPPDIKIEIAAYFDRLQNGADLAYQNYIDRLVIDSCEGFSKLHNATTPKQRQRAADKLDRYIKDLEALRSPVQIH